MKNLMHHTVSFFKRVGHSYTSLIKVCFTIYLKWGLGIWPIARLFQWDGKTAAFGHHELFCQKNKFCNFSATGCVPIKTLLRRAVQISRLLLTYKFTGHTQFFEVFCCILWSNHRCFTGSFFGEKEVAGKKSY